MANNYSISIVITSYNDGKYKETTSYRELKTDSFIQAYDEYEQAVKDRAEIVAILESVKLDVVVKLANGTNVLNRIRLSN